MITVTGAIFDANGVAQHTVISFTSSSTPLASAGVVTANSVNYVRSSPSDGTFSIALVAGNYTVKFTVESRVTTFAIQLSLDDDGGTVSIEDVITTPLTFASVAPYAVWNGERAGHFTFLPVANPTEDVGVELVAYANSHTADETYSYCISYETQEGETEVSPSIDVTPVGSSGTTAIRVSWSTPPDRVTKVRLWRNHLFFNTASKGLLAEISPLTTHYDDWESHADFHARIPADVQSEFNTTAGVIYSSPSHPILYFSESGLRMLDATRFDSTLQIPTGAVSGYVLTSDADGYATWQPSSGGPAGTQMVFGGTAEPEGVQAAPQWSIYTQVDGSGVIVRQWFKLSGSGTTGWA